MSETPLKYLVDAYAPAEMARRVLDVGVAKARLAVPDALALAVLAGAFIGLGAAFATLAMTQTGMGFGPTRVLGGVAFSLGLILVVVAGAELFTGNNLVAMAWASRAIQTRQMVRNWLLVYVGNFVGAMGTVFLVFWTRTWTMADGRFGLNALQIAAAKCDGVCAGCSLQRAGVPGGVVVSISPEHHGQDPRYHLAHCRIRCAGIRA
jgi:formate/nitrite transporter FocA (FNT family)